MIPSHFILSLCSLLRFSFAFRVNVWRLLTGCWLLAGLCWPGLSQGQGQPPVFQSDDFNRCDLAPYWSVIDPQGAATVEPAAGGSGDAYLSLDLPAGTAFDPWSASGNQAPRVMQTVPDTDFTLVVGFRQEPSGGFADQGILVEESGSNWLRFDVFNPGAGPRAFAGRTLNGANQVLTNQAATTGQARYLRLRRTGSQWIYDVSGDGLSWANVDTFTQTLAVSSLGVFAANSFSALAFTAEVDEVRHSASLLANPDSLSFDLNLVVNGNGNVLASPASGPYACGDTLLLTAVPGVGAAFGGYSGAISANVPVVSYLYQGPEAPIVVDFPPLTGPAFASDDFNRCELDSFWTFIDPPGGASVRTVGAGAGQATLRFSLPAGISHNPWSPNGNQSARLMQPGQNDNFQLVAKFDTVPMVSGARIGLIVQQDSLNWLRFDLAANGSNTDIFIGTTRNGNNTIWLNQTVPTDSARFLRINRNDTFWAMERSSDGLSWQPCTTINFPIILREVGLFAGSLTPGLAFDAEVDYFFLGNAPIVPEDGQLNTFTVDLAGNGNGSVLVSPQQAAYACGDTVIVQAQPAAGADFGGFSGSLNSLAFTDTLIIDGPVSITATFLPTPVPPFRSDDFNRCELNDFWTMIDPLQNSEVAISGAGSGNALAELILPAGITHDPWGVTGNESVRIMQPAGNGNVELVVGFESVPGGGFRNQGLIVEQSPTNWLRFDLINPGGNPTLFIGRTTGSTNTLLTTQAAPGNSGRFLRLRRQDTTWTFDRSADGSSWIPVDTLNFSLTITRVGIFAANPVQGQAFTARVDYFSLSSDPLVTEDADLNTLSLDLQGNGNVVLSPNQPTYACGDTVVLTAQPGTGSQFNSWTGSLSGNNLIDTLIISGPDTIGAIFAPLGSCQLSTAGLANLACDNNQTSADPSDDFFSFSLNPSGSNLGAGYVVSGDLSIGGLAYGSAFSFSTAPGSAGNGDLNLILTDVGSSGCVLSVQVADPGICSGPCSLQASGLAGGCDDNGTPLNPADDFFPVTVTVNETFPAGSFFVVVANNTVLDTFAYGNPGTVFLPANGTSTRTLFVQDLQNPGCQALVGTFGPVNFCSRAIRLNADTLQVLPGQQVELAVTVTDFDAVLQAQGSLAWNASVLQFEGISSLALDSVVFDGPPPLGTLMPGRLSFRWQNLDQQPRTLADGDSLFLLTFRVVGNAPGSSPLSFTDLPLLRRFATVNGPSGLETRPGRIEVIAPISFSGRTLAISASTDPLPVFPVRYAFRRADTAFSQSDSSFLFGALAGDSVTIGAQATFADLPQRGLDVGDALRLQQHLVQAVPLTEPYPIIAADVNTDGNLDLTDLELLQALVLTQRQAFPPPPGTTAPRQWATLPAGLSFDDPANPLPYFPQDTAYAFRSDTSRTDLDFVAIKLGDLNQSWLPSDSLISFGDSLPMQVVSADEFIIGNTYPVEIRNGLTADLAAYQLSLRWDPALVFFRGLVAGATSPVADSSDITNGELRLLWTAADGNGQNLPSGTVWLGVNFQALTADTSTSIRLDGSLIPARGYDALGQGRALAPATKAVDLTILNTLVVGPLQAWSPPQPNPFTQQTSWGFALNQPARGRLEVFDLAGRRLYTHEAQLGAGAHRWTWDGRSQAGTPLPEGMYLGRFFIGEQVKLLRLIKQ